ncbi:30S ribosomal protein S18 [Candidatus Shapirobacteria bacterium]|nr:30S ribosomal protein S18 [Candidatus Shapirobacteria bacterium]
MKRPKRRKTRIFKPRPCQFCETGKSPDYREYLELKKYLSIRGGILSRARNGNCAKHQRQLTKSIKQARHLGLLPFVASVRK